MNMVELAERLSELDLDGDWALPVPGAGKTPARHRWLLDMGRQDLSLARVAEAHTDALAILAEAECAAHAGALYGVWASEGPQSRVEAKRLDGKWRLDGIKQYCSAAPFATAALVTARADEAVLLFDVPLDGEGIRILPSAWASPALADTSTGPVAFDGVTLPATSVIGGANWYLTRPGFWHGAIGPAACWAGGAVSLVEHAGALNRRDPHSRAHLGALQAAAWGMVAVLDQAGRDIDADPRDTRQEARTRALKVRHLIERWCAEILDRFGRATGPQLLAHEGEVVRQHQALTVYIRQCHGERDLETIPG
jgi:alkylation response protein AidB-like acyl-CoA dehydrogenase